MLKGKKIVIGITGGIAAYKIPWLIRDLVKAGAEVRVVMTESAAQFVTPLTLSTVSANPVTVGMFPGGKEGTINADTWHVTLGHWADIMLIAPATANTLAKLAHGYADNAVTTLALALRCPLALSPSMDVDMWQHQATQENIVRLKELGYRVLAPDTGALASGLTGAGRLPGLEAIIEAVDGILSKARLDLKGKRILVTAGPTYESIDPVRFVGNRSSGKMGFAIARAAAERGAEVTLVSGPARIQTPRNVKRLDVESAQQMADAVMHERKRTNAVIMAAAVADFTPAHRASQKIKKEELESDTYSLPLVRTTDILEQLGKRKNGMLLVGFALETEDDLANARKKLHKKNLDLVVLNNPTEEGAGFGGDTNIITIIRRDGKTERLEKMLKDDVAHKILDQVVRMM